MLKIYKIPAEKLKTVKAVLEAPDRRDPNTGKWIANEWALRGYKLTDAKGLGLEGTDTYIYVKADEDFFKRNEQKILECGAIILSGEEFEKVKKKFEIAEEQAESGFGAIFGE
ncbi:MAG: hypothetical protein ACP5IJ_01045 [Candidatus Nanoarchaeia archaeon]